MKQLRRSQQQQMIAGVCGGLAEYFNMDPSIVRLIYVLVSIFSAAFPGILVYLVLWVIIPKAQVEVLK
jgi:phage shock protein C